jgi:hypothetical protein
MPVALLAVEQQILHAIKEQLRNDASIESLLHLGAMATLLAIGYLGIDRIHRASERFETVDRKQTEEAEKWRAELELNIEVDDGQGRMVTNPAFANRFAYVLLYACGYDVRPGLKMILYFFYRQGYAPGLNYFRKNHHLAYMSVVAICSSLAFLTLIVLIITRSPYADVKAFQYAAFSVFTLSLLFTVMSTVVYYTLLAFMPRRLKTARNGAERLLDTLKRALLPK